MATIAIYSLKGGVGKTTLAVNLAWCSAVLSKRRTLLWDLDPQSAATYLLGDDATAHDRAQAVFSREVDAQRLIQMTRFDDLDLLPADVSLRGLDQFLFALGKRKRLARLIEGLARRYDHIMLDCPPGLTPTSEQMVRAADLILVPVVPSPLARRAYDEFIAWRDREGAGQAIVMPVYSMVDRRRALHRTALEAQADWPTIPMASVIELTSLRQTGSRKDKAEERHSPPPRNGPVGAVAPRSPAARAMASLWQSIEERLAASH